MSIDRDEIAQIQDKKLQSAIGVTDEEYGDLENLLLMLKDSTMGTAFLQPWHAGPEEKCPGCNVWKGQLHAPECKNK